MSILDTIHPRVRSKALKLQALAKSKFNINIKFTQGLRTNAQQYAYWCKGRLPLPDVNAAMKAANLPFISERDNIIVTKAKSAASSFHGYGLAFDIVIVLSDGKTITYKDTADTNNDGVTDWDQVGSLADECGLEWGGNFSSIADKPHYQDRFGYTIAALTSAGVPSGQILTLHPLTIK